MLRGRFINDKIAMTYVLLISILFLAGCSADNADPASETANAPNQHIVEVQEAAQTEWNDSLQLTGMVTSTNQSQIIAVFGGKVLEVLVRNGDIVQAGDVLVRLDPTDAQLGIQQAQAGLEAAKLQLESAKSMRQQSIKQAGQQLEQSNQALQMIENAQETLDNPSEMQQDDTIDNHPVLDQGPSFLERWLGEFTQITPPDLGSFGDFNLEEELTRAQGAVQAAEMALELANRTDGIDAAEANVQQAEIGLKMAQRQAEQAVITSPISGEVVNLIVQENGMAAPQMPLMSIIQTDEFMIRTDASEREVVHIQPEQSVRLIIPAVDQELEGIVTYISPVPGQESRKYPVELAFADEHVENVRIGMLAQALIDAEAIQGMEVPINALVEAGENQDKTKAYVFVIAEEADQARVERREVIVAQETSENALITEGLHAGEKVVIRGQQSLSDGDLVTIRKSSQTEADS